MAERKLPPAEIRWQYLVCEIGEDDNYRPVAAFMFDEDADFFASSSDGAYEGLLVSFEWDEGAGVWSPCFLEDGSSQE